MDNADLFSRRDAAEYVASGEVCGKRVEYPTFSDRQGAELPVFATRRS